MYTKMFGNPCMKMIEVHFFHVELALKQNNYV
jgi:hypothetical protein